MRRWRSAAGRFLVDDHEVVRTGLRALLEGDGDIGRGGQGRRCARPPAFLPRSPTWPTSPTWWAPSSSPRLRRRAVRGGAHAYHRPPALSHGGVEKLGGHRRRWLLWGTADPRLGRPRVSLVSHQRRLTTQRARCGGRLGRDEQGTGRTPGRRRSTPCRDLSMDLRDATLGIATDVRQPGDARQGRRRTWCGMSGRARNNSGIGKWRPRGVAAILQAPLSGKRRVSQPFSLRTGRWG